MAKKKTIRQSIKVKPHASIGASAAEDDHKYLASCFVDTGDAQIAKDIDSPKSILLGRTGAGKSALLINLQDTSDHVIKVNPESLSLGYISNSNILSFFEGIGVDLDVFYQLLWRHVLCVELLQYYFNLKSEGDMRRLKDWLSSIVKKNKSKELGIKYLERWNSEFWSEREERIKEITTKMEEQLSSSVGANLGGAKLGVEGSASLSEAVKSEVQYKAQKVVNDIQIRDLGEVINLLSEDLFNDKQKRYYIIIDKLDEKWVDDVTRCKLIRALIEAIKSFRRISSLKIIVALRSDLLERVYRVTSDYGFQPEKYEDLNLRIRWSNENLKNLVESRLNQLFEWEYSKSKGVNIYDVFPEKVSDKPFLEYVIQRSLMRPRDVIAFVNTILQFGEGKEKITEKIVRDAEAVYSDSRKEALLNEWFAEHPSLRHAFKFIQQKGARFKVQDVPDSDLDDLVISLSDEGTSPGDDILSETAKHYFEGKLKREEFIKVVLQVLYKVGAIGIKPAPYSNVQYCYDITATLSDSQVYEATDVHIHPMLWRAFGVYKKRN